MNLSPVRSVLFLGAHSDDIEIGCAATILELLDDNACVDVDWIVFSGQAERIEEAYRSAEMLLSRCTGRVNIQVESFRDSYFPAEWAAIKDYVHALSKRVRPDVIFTHRRDDLHQDHRVLSEITSCAFRNQRVLEYEIPKYDGDLGQPNVFVPVSAAHAQEKCDLLLECFRSQRGRQWFSEGTFQAMLRLRGLESNSPSGFAEAFHARKLCLTASELVASTTPVGREEDAMPLLQGAMNAVSG